MLARLVAGRPELGVVVTDAQLVADIARGYDVVVMGADKWAQVNDPAWYDSPAARDAALAALPRVLVVPRPGFAHRRRGDPRRRRPTSPRCPRARRVPAPTTSIARPRATTRRRRDERHRHPPRRLVARPRRRCTTVDRRVAGVRRAAAVTGSRSSSTAGRSPTSPKACTTACSSRTPRRGGRDAADDRIVEEVERDRDPSSLVVVTSDQGLRARVHALGARTEGASQLLTDLESGSP